MKKLYFLGVFLTTSFLSFAADEYIEPVLVEDVCLQRISPAGKTAVGQDGLGSCTVVYNFGTGETEWYPACFFGDGNCVADNGSIAGYEMQVTGMCAVVMRNEKLYSNPSLKTGGFSIFNAITPDGSRACGYILNSSGKGPYFSPMYCNISPNGAVEKHVLLPCPDLDFFGNRATYIMCGTISDDGKTIVGLVYDGTQSYSWPIIFREDENGKWSYTEPTKSLFNPNNEPIPVRPPQNFNRENEPKVEDYMTPEQIEAYHKKLEEYGGNYDAYWNFMTNEAYHQYLDDHIKWADEVGEQYIEENAEYNAFMRRAGKDLHFGGILLIDHNGEWMVTAKSGVPYKFNLKDDTFEPLNIATSGITITQILPDGTYVGCSTTNGVPYQTYIKRPDSDRFVKVTDYLEENNRSYLYWLEDSFLNVNGTIVTGIMAFSDDMKQMFGGYYDGDGGAISYIFPNMDAEENGVDTIEIEESMPQESFEVYNLNGIKINSVKSESDLNKLPKGIYVVNGKKVAL